MRLSQHRLSASPFPAAQGHAARVGGAPGPQPGAGSESRTCGTPPGQPGTASERGARPASDLAPAAKPWDRKSMRSVPLWWASGCPPVSRAPGLPWTAATHSVIAMAAAAPRVHLFIPTPSPWPDRPAPTPPFTRTAAHRSGMPRAQEPIRILPRPPSRGTVDTRLPDWRAGAPAIHVPHFVAFCATDLAQNHTSVAERPDEWKAGGSVGG